MVYSQLDPHDGSQTIPLAEMDLDKPGDSK